MSEADFQYIIDTFFTLFAMVLIIFMVPGFAMLEAGLVRTKNVTAVLTTNIMIYAVASMAFLLIGYSIAFGSWENSSQSIWAAFLFQMAFVGKTVNIMSGGVSERTRMIPLAIFTIVMGAVIYPLVVNISWGADILAGTILDIDDLLPVLLDHLNQSYLHLQAGDIKFVQQKWRQICCHLNKPVSIFTNYAPINGVFAGVDEYGFALVNDGRQIRRITNYNKVILREDYAADN